jgi:anthranilate synthase component 1
LPALATRLPRRLTSSEQDLPSDAKEIAEHLMLIDLGRNDAGVSETGTVKVTEKMVIELPNVMHISFLNVNGQLKQGLAMMDALRAILPAGKLFVIAPCKFIDELVSVKRGVYGGAVISHQTVIIWIDCYCHPAPQ